MFDRRRNSPRFSSSALFVAALLAVSVFACGKDTTSARASVRGKEQGPRQVHVVAAAVERLPRTVTVTGTLAADEDVVAGFKVAGRVSEIAVDLGSPVRRGQVLARLDPTDFRLRVEQAEAALRQVRAGLGLPRDGSGESVDPEKTASVRETRAVLEEARLNRDRAVRLSEKNYIARSEVDASTSRLAVAESRYQAALEEIRNRQELLAERSSGVALARQQLADAVLVAPIDGVVRERRASVGEYLAAGAPVVSLVRVHPLRLRVAVPERDASSVRVGQAVRIRLEGDVASPAGRVVRLSPSLQEQSRTLIVEAEVANRGGRLRPGSFARAEIVVEADRSALMVPASAIVTFAGVERVFVVSDGRAVERRIRTGRRSGDRVEVLDGATRGEQVVVSPGNLAGGQPVIVSR